METSDIDKRALKGGSAARPDLTKLPVRVTREQGAALVTQFYFKVSPRSLERWPIPWRHLNGKAHGETVDLVRHAEAVVASAPATMGGHAGGTNK
jgi:hypothetical protein